jgi:hypothetical protein
MSLKHRIVIALAEAAKAYENSMTQSIDVVTVSSTILFLFTKQKVLCGGQDFKLYFLLMAWMCTGLVTPKVVSPFRNKSCT